MKAASASRHQHLSKDQQHARTQRQESDANMSPQSSRIHARKREVGQRHTIRNPPRGTNAERNDRALQRAREKVGSNEHQHRLLALWCRMNTRTSSGRDVPANAYDSDDELIDLGAYERTSDGILHFAKGVYGMSQIESRNFFRISATSYPPYPPYC